MLALLLLVCFTFPLTMAGCDRHDHESHDGHSHDHTHTAPHDHAHPAHHDAQTPSDLVEIPAAVRMNLGITFARAEHRNVAQTLRVPGQFELLPTARREYRSPVAGRVELLVNQYQKVEAGTPLYQVDSAAWRGLHEDIAATQAQLGSMAPLREAHQRHQKILADKVKLWEDRLKQLDELRAAGGGNAAQFTEARATLNATQAELVDLIEQDAGLQAQHQKLQAALRSLISRRALLIRSAGGKQDDHDNSLESHPGLYIVRSMTAGVVENLHITPGGLIEENAAVVTLIQPEQIRFRAKGLQSDSARLKDGLPARIVPLQGGMIPQQEIMPGSLQMGPIADAADRTLDLVAQPESLAPWARAGMAAYLEITLAGGSEELAIPLAAVIRDGVTPIVFRRDPENPDRAIRMKADLGVSDGRWIVVTSGLRLGDEVVVNGNYQLMLATRGAASQAGHFHADGTFHTGGDH